MTAEQQEETEIREAMAKAFFASAWADLVEESDSEDAPNLSGCEIMDVMPDELDPAAIEAAESLASGMVKANGKSLFDLMAIVERDGDGDRPNTAEMFGHYAAMQAMGHGVGLDDAFGSAVYDAIKVPYHEFGSCYLQRDYFGGDDE